MDHSNYDAVKTSDTKRKLKAEKEALLKRKAVELKEMLDESQTRYFETAQEKGASSWLAALPLKRLGYTLNKQEFQDAIRLRYGWKIKGIPNICSCGKANDVDHTLICHKGGFVNMRHDAIRDVEAKLMQKVCRDVVTEPVLLPVNPAELRPGTNSAQNARLDLSARDLWSGGEKNFYDVRVTHANAASLRDKSLTQIYRMNENEKKNLYNERVQNVEKGTFTPLVFLTSGGMGPECLKFNKRIAEKTADKQNETYSQVMMHIRTRLRFALLKSTLIGLRGFRGKRSKAWEEDEDIDFNLIPQSRSYET